MADDYKRYNVIQDKYVRIIGKEDIVLDILRIINEKILYDKRLERIVIWSQFYGRKDLQVEGKIIVNALIQDFV